MKKPKCKLIGEDGNIFNLLAQARRALTRNQQTEKAKEMTDKIYATQSYDEALQVVMTYVEVV